MAHPAVVTAVEDRLEALWTLCPTISMNTQGEAPDDGSPYLVVQYPASNVSRPPLHTRLYREEGGIRFIIHAQRGAGTEQPLDWAETLSALFRDQRFDGVTTQAPGSPVLDDENDNGNYFLVSFVSPYTYNFEG